MAKSGTNAGDVAIPQVSFAGGEVAPGIYGRVDLAKFQIGLRRCYNCFIEITGGVSNRPGWRWDTEVKDSTRFTRIEEFAATEDDTFLIEFGHLYVKILYRGAYVLDDFLNEIDLVSPFGEAQLRGFSFDQVNDVMTIVHPQIGVYELTRVTNSNWTLAIVNFNSTVAAPTGLTVIANPGSAATDRVQKYRVAAVDNRGEESPPSSILTTNNSFENADDSLTLQWNAVTGAVRYNVYKYQGGIFSYMGSTTDLTIIDNNIVPNVADTPKITNNFLSGGEGIPSVVFYSQQRRGFAALNGDPQAVVYTESGLFNSFRYSFPTKATDAFKFSLAAKKVQKIHHVVALEDLLIFTPTTEWRIAGANGVSATEAPDARPQSFYGISNVRPLVIGSDILYVQRLGQTVYRMNYSNDFNRYVSEEMTVLARHLLRRSNKVDNWTYSQSPYSLVWSARSDGKFLSMTYSREQQIFAWGQHETYGTVEWLANVNEDGVDVTYAVIRRKINGTYKRYIEHLDQRNLEDYRQAFFVDSGSTYDQPKNITLVTVAGGTGYTTVYVTAHGWANGDSVYLDPPTSMPGLTGRFKIGDVTANNFRIYDFETGLTLVDGSTFGTYESGTGGIARKMVTVLSGFGHLEGMQVVGLADGNVIGMDGSIVVTGGDVTLPEPSAIVHVGLGYYSEIETLELDLQGATKQGAVKTAPYVHLRVEDTRGIEVSINKENYKEIKPRQYEAMYDPPNTYTGLIRASLPPDWGDELKLRVRQSYPLPMTILATIPKVQFGGT